MDFQTLQLAVQDRIAVVTLNRPPVNAQNAELRAEITQVFDELSDREDVSVVVLTGAGKVFPRVPTSASAPTSVRPRAPTAATTGWCANRSTPSSNAPSPSSRPSTGPPWVRASVW